MPLSVRWANRRDRIFGAIPRLCEKSSNFVAPWKASRRIKMLHHSPTVSTARPTGHSWMEADLGCMVRKYGCNFQNARDKGNFPARKDEVRDCETVSVIRDASWRATPALLAPSLRAERSDPESLCEKDSRLLCRVRSDAVDAVVALHQRCRPGEGRDPSHDCCCGARWLPQA